MPAASALKLNAATSAGRLLQPMIVPNPATGGHRVTFDLDPGNALHRFFNIQRRTDRMQSRQIIDPQANLPAMLGNQLA